MENVVSGCGRNGGLQIMQKGYRGYVSDANVTRGGWTWDTQSFPGDLLDRGFPEVKNPGSDDDVLPEYVYRDFGYMIWYHSLHTSPLFVLTSIDPVMQEFFLRICLQLHQTSLQLRWNQP